MTASLQCPFQGDYDSRIFFSPVPHRVCKQIIEDPFELFSVHPDRKFSFPAEIFDFHLLVFHIRAHKLQILFHIILKICFLHVIPETGVQSAVLRKAVYKADQISGSCLYGLQVTEPLFRCI